MVFGAAARRLKVVILIVSTIVLGTETSAAQTGETTGTIRGRVVDEGGRPVVTATVVVAGSDLFASTDANGRYVVFDVPEGIYLLEATSPGFSEATADSVRVVAGETTEIDFHLSSSKRFL